MPPIYDNFACPPGETLTVGKFVTSPEPGKRLNVSKNKAGDVDYDWQLNGVNGGPYTHWHCGYGTTRSFSSMAYSWSGMVLCPNYGTKGGIAVHGGGHGGFQGQFLHLWDVGLRIWKRIGTANLPANFGWAGYPDAPSSVYTGAADVKDVDWRDYSFNGGKIMLHDHSYNTCIYITPAEGGGLQGSLFIPSSPRTQNPSDPPATPFAPHLFNLDTGVITRAMSTLPGVTIQDNNEFIAVKDTKRSILWYFRHGSVTAWKIPLTGGAPFAFSTHSIQKAGGGLTDTFFPGMASAWEYAEDADAIVLLGTGAQQLNAPLSFMVIDMSTGVPIDLKLTGLPTTTLYHGGFGPSMSWCPAQRAFYIYEGFGDTYCTVLRPSTLNFATCSWAWSRESFGGDAPANGRGAWNLATSLEGAYRRLFWIPSLGCFEWNDGPDTSGVCLDGQTRDGVVQLWRPPGTVMA